MGRDYIPKAKTLGVPEPTPPETAQIRQISEGQNKRVRAAQVSCSDGQTGRAAMDVWA
jgi:hypothetical protein